MKLVELPSPNWGKLQNCILNFISHITKNFFKIVKSSPKVISEFVVWTLWTLRITNAILRDINMTLCVTNTSLRDINVSLRVTNTSLRDISVTLQLIRLEL